MRPHNPLIWTMLGALAMAGCTAKQPAVEQFGAMRDVMRDGHTQARIRLADAVVRPHALGVGALEGLAGEVTIVDGDVWVARVTDGGVRVTGPLPRGDESASLLTLAHVPRWRTVAIQSPAAGEELAELIVRAAQDIGIDTARPFPFMIEGAPADLAIHVINGYCPMATDPSAVGAVPWTWSATAPVDVVIVGFHAEGAAGVMTHHGTTIHAHAVLSIDGRTVAGHVDRLAVAPGMFLHLPAVD
ncbi:MAG: hypothetical protein KDA22_13520 [Phycisphaerales bacterium]|nr:hypothetical protein [Phycisphaerales bacterium]